MRHRIKKIPTLSKLNHLLHSDKSTYTYFCKGKVRDFFKSRLTPTQPCTNGVWCASPHQDLADSHSESARLNRTQRSQDITPYSAAAGRANRLGNSRFSTIPLVLSAFGLLLVLGLTINPMIGSTEQASAVGQDFGAERTVSLSIINNGTELSDNAMVSTDATPGVVSYIDNTIRINTSKIAKYYVGVQAAVDGSSDLVGSQYGETIAGVGDKVSPASFGDNTWGYSLTDNTTVASNTLTYSTLPAYNTNSPLQYTSPTNPTDGNHDLKLTFAAKINANKPSDHYQTKAMVSVAADAKTMTLSEISYMQDMMPDICSASTEHETKQLIDKRDSKSYWVTKLKDGNCWMTQNLDLDLNERTLTTTDSDVKTDWMSTTGESGLWLATDRNVVKYYDPGEYVETTPSELDICGGMVEDRAGVESLGACAENGIKNVAGLTPSNDPSFGEGIVDNTYNAHYSIGNYYSWAAMIANSVPGLNTSADESICAKGWTLPNDHGEKGYMNLLSSYGYVWSEPEVADQIRSYATLPGSEDNDGMHSYVTVAPMYFSHSGMVYDGRIYFASSSGIFGTREFNSAGIGVNHGAYRFDLYASIAVYAHEALWDGLQVRCVAR